MTYIPKQPKHPKERVEAKLELSLIEKLERYCEYLDSDRDYVVSQALEIAFKKDKGFGEWLQSQGPAGLPTGQAGPGELPAPDAVSPKPARKSRLAKLSDQNNRGTAAGVPPENAESTL